MEEREQGIKKDGIRMAPLGDFKFKDEIFLTRLLWYISLDRGALADEAGDTICADLWAGLFDWAEESEDMIAMLNQKATKELKETPLTPEEQALIRGTAGAIITENGQGLVYGGYYATKEELVKTWEQVKASLETSQRKV